MAALDALDAAWGGLAVAGLSDADLLAVNERPEAKACPTPAGLAIWEWRGQRTDEPAPSHSDGYTPAARRALMYPFLERTAP